MMTILSKLGQLTLMCKGLYKPGFLKPILVATYEQVDTRTTDFHCFLNTPEAANSQPGQRTASNGARVD